MMAITTKTIADTEDDDNITTESEDAVRCCEIEWSSLTMNGTVFQQPSVVQRCFHA